MLSSLFLIRVKVGAPDHHMDAETNNNPHPSHTEDLQKGFKQGTLESDLLQCLNNY